MGFPNERCTYWEPFVGGGALFFAIADEVSKAVLSDKNKELITTYKVVQSQLSDLIKRLSDHQREHMDLGEVHYYRTRKQIPNSPVDIAARFIYLNKTCFNGLYRVNSKGEFNVPIGRYKDPKICDRDLLEAVSKSLQKAELRVADFRDRDVITPRLGDVVYCDPPYDQSFTQYVPGGFDRSEQHALRVEAEYWGENARVMVSNADTKLIRCIWGGGRRDFNFIR